MSSQSNPISNCNFSNLTSNLLTEQLPPLLSWAELSWAYWFGLVWSRLVSSRLVWLGLVWSDCDCSASKISTIMSDGRDAVPSFDQDMCSPSSVAIYTPAKIYTPSTRGLDRKISFLGAAKRSITKAVRNDGHRGEHSSPYIRSYSKSLHVGRPKVEGHYMKTTEASRYSA